MISYFLTALIAIQDPTILLPLIQRIYTLLSDNLSSSHTITSYGVAGGIVVSLAMEQLIMQQNPPLPFQEFTITPSHPPLIKRPSLDEQSIKNCTTYGKLSLPNKIYSHRSNHPLYLGPPPNQPSRKLEITLTRLRIGYTRVTYPPLLLTLPTPPPKLSILSKQLATHNRPVIINHHQKHTQGPSQPCTGAVQQP